MTALTQKIQQFREWTSCEDEVTAAVFLKGNEDNIEKAVAAFFNGDNPSSYEAQNRYDESAFHDERRYGPITREEDSTLIHHNQDTWSQVTALGAPSRPPSRTGLLRNQHVDNIESEPLLLMDRPSQEQQDMDKAVQMSLAEAEQQMGTVDRAGRDLVPDPSPDGRRRLEGQPAFLKPLTRLNFLPSMVTILHTIPQCRRVLLSKEAGEPLKDYNWTEDWWRGESTRNSLMSHSNHSQVVHELQRLMVFLDQTTRCYGSVGALQKLLATTDGLSSSDVALRPEVTLQDWEAAAESCLGRSIFTSRVADADGSKPFQILEVSARLDVTTLYDVLDNLFWPDDTSPAPAHSLTSCAEVFLIWSLPYGQMHKNITIPAVWYCDRYLRANLDWVEEMRSKLAELRQIVDVTNKKLERLQNFNVNGKTRSDGVQLLDTVVDFLKKSSEIDEAAQQLPADNLNSPNHVATTATLAKLEVLNQRLQLRIETLNKEKAKAEESLRILSLLLTEPNVEYGPVPRHRYMLRGVSSLISSRRNVTYVLHPKKEEVVVGPTDQWWKMTYDWNNLSPSISKQPVSEAEVLLAAGDTRHETMLVYATDKMLDTSNTSPDIPPGLQDFINSDNDAFQHELVPGYHVEAMEISPFDHGASDEEDTATHEIHVAEFDGEADAANVQPVEVGSERGVAGRRQRMATWGEGQGLDGTVDPTVLGNAEVSETMQEIEGGSPAKRIRQEQRDGEESSRFEDVDMDG